MTEKTSRLSWTQWSVFALIGGGLPLATCRRSLAGPVDFPVLADVVTTAFYVVVLVCLGVALAVSLPRSG